MPVDIAGMSLAEIERRIEKVERLAALWRGQVIFLTGQVEEADQYLADLHDARRRRQLHLVETPDTMPSVRR
jgi:hypothetical protein